MPGAQPDVIARLDADVAARRYTGLQDYDDWRGARDDLYGGYWDPDEAAAAGGLYAAFPRYPGLLDRAQAPFDAAGLDVPWYISRGNHDGLVQGNARRQHGPVPRDRGRLPEGLPDAARSTRRCSRARDESALFQRFSDPAFISSLLAGGRTVPPDADRRIVSKAEYRALMREGDRKAHGFGATDARELRSAPRARRATTRSTPQRGLRIISLDTVAEGGGQNGNLDDPQYRWLKRELRKARRRDQLVVLFGHHTLETMSNTTADEDAGPCAAGGRARLRRRPAPSTPLHRGTAGKRSVRALLAANPQRDRLRRRPHARRTTSRFFGGRRGGGFWQINTASHIDWPQQSRLIEVMDNRDGTLSIFGTMLDSAAPAGRAAARRRARRCRSDQLVSLSRTLSYNDPQREGAEGSGEPRRRRGARARPQRRAAGARPAVATIHEVDRVSATLPADGSADRRLRPRRRACSSA